MIDHENLGFFNSIGNKKTDWDQKEKFNNKYYCKTIIFRLNFKII